jgi:TonB family protein
MRLTRSGGDGSYVIVFSGFRQRISDAGGLKVSIRTHRRPGRTSIAVVLCVGALCAGHLFAAPGSEDSKQAKITELVQLQGLAKMMEQSKAAGRQEAAQIVRSMTDRMSAQFSNIPPEKRMAIEAASQRFLSEVDNSFDQDDAVRAWGRFYSEGLTEQELDAILAYYRSPAGQKDIRASQAALPQLQKYMMEKRTAATNTAVANYAAALREIVNPSKAESIQPDRPPLRFSGSDPSAPDGKVVANSVSDRCEAPPSVESPAQHVSPSGRSVLCVCVDEKGTLTQAPVITESSGDSRVDSGAVKLARLDSGRYQPPAVDGKPQKGCFRFAINFRHPE